MVRCSNCKTIQHGDSATCQACGTPIGDDGNGATQGSSNGSHGAVVPGQEGRGRSTAGQQEATGRLRTGNSGSSGPQIVPGQEGRGTVAVAAPTSPPPAPAAPSTPPPSTPPPSPPPLSEPPVVPVGPSAGSQQPMSAPPLGSGPVVLGSASDPGIGGSGPVYDAGAHGAYTVAGPSGPHQIVVGPEPEPPSGGKALKVLALVVSSLVLIALIALVVVVVTGKEDLTVGPSSTVSSTTTTAPTTTVTTLPTSGPVAVTASAAKSTVETGSAITINVSVAGDQNAIQTTALIINGSPSPEISPGPRNSFTIDAGPVPGDVKYKVLITMKDQKTVESNEVAVKVESPPPPPTAPPTPPPTVPPTPRPTTFVPSNRTPAVVTSPGCGSTCRVYRRTSPYDDSKGTSYRIDGDRVSIICSSTGRFVHDGDTGRESSTWYLLDEPSGDWWMSSVYLSVGDYVPSC